MHIQIQIHHLSSSVQPNRAQEHFAMEWCDRNSTVSECDTFFCGDCCGGFFPHSMWIFYVRNFSSFYVYVFFLESIDPPTIRLHGAPQIDLEEGKDSLVLRCEADANPPASIVWKRAGRSEIASLQVSTTLIDFSFSILSIVCFSVDLHVHLSILMSCTYDSFQC